MTQLQEGRIKELEGALEHEKEVVHKIAERAAKADQEVAFLMEKLDKTESHVEDLEAEAVRLHDTIETLSRGYHPEGGEGDDEERYR